MSHDYRIPKLIEATTERILEYIQPYCKGEVKIQYGFTPIGDGFSQASIGIRERQKGLFGLEKMVTLVDISQEMPHFHEVRVRSDLPPAVIKRIHEEMQKFRAVAPTENYAIISKRFMRKALLEF